MFKLFCGVLERVLIFSPESICRVMDGYDFRARIKFKRLGQGDAYPFVKTVKHLVELFYRTFRLVTNYGLLIFIVPIKWHCINSTAIWYEAII